MPPAIAANLALNDTATYEGIGESLGPSRRRLEAYERAVRQCGGRLLAVARRFLRNDEDARDTVQDALLSAFTRIERFEQRAQLSTWLHRIVVNAALMKLRSRRRKPEELTEDPLGDTTEGAPRLGDSAFAPADALLERRETRALVRRCIDSLPDTYRTVLLLRDIEELDTTETAHVLGVTPIVVRCRLHRARRALRTLLESHI
jgi:RNA polymerase sigma-70 factor (ECF subfamily)